MLEETPYYVDDGSFVAESMSPPILFFPLPHLGQKLFRVPQYLPKKKVIRFLMGIAVKTVDHTG